MSFGEPMRSDAPRPSNVPAGYDRKDPYDAVDEENLPAWWRENMETFRTNSMRPYRPPKFADGALVPEVLSRLEQEYDIDVHLRKRITGDVNTDWQILVDDEPVGSMKRIRDESGQSTYDIPGEELAAAVREAVDCDT
jgi:hypothetical protein